MMVKDGGVCVWAMVTAAIETETVAGIATAATATNRKLDEAVTVAIAVQVTGDRGLVCYSLKFLNSTLERHNQ